LKSIFSFSYKVHIFKILNLIENKLDILIIGKFLDLSSIGIYSVSVSLTQIFQTLFIKSISTVLLPLLTSEENLEKKKYIAVKYLKLSMLLALVFNLLLILFGYYLILFLFGADFILAYIPMVILTIGSFLKAPIAILNAFFKSINKPETMYKSSINSLIINILLCFILIPKIGIIGAAIASTISYAIYALQMIFKFKKETAILYTQFIFNKEDFLNLKVFIFNKIKGNR